MKFAKNLLDSFYQEFISLLKSKTAKDSLVVFIGNFLSAGLGFLSTIIISRTLGPVNFGIISTTMAAISMIAGLTDFGVTTGLVRFVSLYLRTNEEKAKHVLKISFEIKLIISVLTIVVGILLAKPLAALFFGNENYSLLMKLAIIGAIGVSLGNYINSVLQSYQFFKKLSCYQVISSFLKLLGILLLFYTGNFYKESIVFITVLVSIIGFLIGFYLIPKSFLKHLNYLERRNAFNELYHFNKWLVLSYIATAITGRIDVIMISHFQGSRDVGVYSAAYQVSNAFPIVISVLTSVLLPKVSKMIRYEEFVDYIKKCFTVFLFFVITLAPIFLFSRHLIVFLYGVAYEPATGVFKILMIGFLLTILINPISLVLYSMNRPDVLTYLNFISMLIILVLDYFLISEYGILGAASVNLIATFIAGIYISFTLYNQIKKLKVNSL